jgi:hypothetical protein
MTDRLGPRGGYRGRRAALVLAFASLPTIAVLAPSSAGTAPVAVLSSGADEIYPAVDDGVLSWAQNTRDRPRHYDTFVRTAGGTRKQVNAPGTFGWSSDIDGTHVIYQQVSERRNRPDRSDLHLFDLTTLTRSFVEGVNTQLWEWRPRMSGDLVLFARSNINIQADEWQRVLLYDRSTQQTRILAEVAGARKWLVPGQVNGNFATWERCEPGFVDCDVFLYQVDTQMVTELDDGGVQQRPGVVAADGTAYVERVGGRNQWKCGLNARIVRFPLGGTGTVIATIPSGKDILTMNVHTNADGTGTLVFDRYDCDNGVSDIFRLDDADTATVATATPTRQATGVGPLPSSLSRTKTGLADRALPGR